MGGISGWGNGSIATTLLLNAVFNDFVVLHPILCSCVCVHFLHAKLLNYNVTHWCYFLHVHIYASGCACAVRSVCVCVCVGGCGCGWVWVCGLLQLLNDQWSVSIITVSIGFVFFDLNLQDNASYIPNSVWLATIGAVTRDGLTPLGLAVREGELYTIKYLIMTCNVDVNGKL